MIELQKESVTLSEMIELEAMICKTRQQAWELYKREFRSSDTRNILIDVIKALVGAIEVLRKPIR